MRKLIKSYPTVKELYIVFENLDSVTIPAYAFHSFMCDGVTERLSVDASNSAYKTCTCCYFSVVLKSDAKNIKTEYSKLYMNNVECDLFTLIIKSKNIASVRLVFADESEEGCYVPWCDEGDDHDYHNRYQTAEMDGDELKIEIEEQRQ